VFNSMVGSDLTHKHYTRLARDKHTNFLQAFVNYDRKKVYNIGPLPWAIIILVVKIYNSRIACFIGTANENFIH